MIEEGKSVECDDSESGEKGEVIDGEPPEEVNTLFIILEAAANQDAEHKEKGGSDEDTLENLDWINDVITASKLNMIFKSL